MNRKQAIAAALLAFTGTAVWAQADLQHFGAPQQAASTTTREAVRAEVLRARAAGETLVPAEADVAGLFPKAATKGQASQLTRAEVRAEVLKAQADGSLTRLRELDIVGERAVASVRTRDEVRNEAIAATRAPRVQAGH
jgi:hypothetical protein